MDYTIYSEKEVLIFNGLIDLIKGGANPYSIKVSDIAKAADIGKGTIYDYFKSKEEVISKAILYIIYNEIKEAKYRIESKTGFKEKYYETLNIITENINNNLSTFNLLLSTGGIMEFYEYIRDEKNELIRCLSIIEEIINDFLQEGVEEGLITTDENHFYKMMAVRSAISGYSGFVNNKKYHSLATIEEAMDASYKLLIKALN